ncbi:alginate O-acetyltransferase AlgX-related protein [Yersinia enterocolitica]|uniref:alginate O-acetyltransferase AlgX-related protein n=1 Tax=Yersinia TaxID=629 RepID=UPI003AB32600
MIKNKHGALPDSNHRSRPHMIFVWIMFSVSLLPIILVILQSPALFGPLINTFPSIKSFSDRYLSKVEPVGEMRVLSKFPEQWDGPWYAVDKNYGKFDKWFNDNMGFRDLFIRSKNELDYRLFGSSTRVYYGADNYIYGRTLIDNELPSIEREMDSPESRNSIINGMAKFSEDLKKQGVTTYFVTPMQKEYFIKDRLPFFAPRIPQDSNFMHFYSAMKDDSRLNIIDVEKLIKSVPDEYRTFYTQDFHWTNISAYYVSRDIVNQIAEKEGSKLLWDHKLEVEYAPFLGSDSRFSSRLIANEYVMEPNVKQTWQPIHKINQFDASKTGLEFDTDSVLDKGLLPETCMFGNSFSDGMLVVGLTDFFSKFTKLDRSLPLSDIPKLIDGKCKYLIVQILDIQRMHWLYFKSQYRKEI